MDLEESYTKLSRVNDLNSVIINESQLNRVNADSQSAINNANCQWIANTEPDLASVLEQLDEIKVHQHLDVVEVCLGWERNNRYSLYNNNGDQILYIYESAQCVARQCYGSLRELTLVVTDNDDNRLLYLQRPLRCSSRCFYACCCLQEMSVISPLDATETLGVIKERWTLCAPYYEFLDPLGCLKFTIQGNCCHFHCCCDIKFTVKSSSGYDMATIYKNWAGCKDIIGAHNDFIITYLDGLSKKDKVLILGATFLLDFNYFERHGRCF